MSSSAIYYGIPLLIGSIGSYFVGVMFEEEVPEKVLTEQSGIEQTQPSSGLFGTTEIPDNNVTATSYPLGTDITTYAPTTSQVSPYTPISSQVSPYAPVSQSPSIGQTATTSPTTTFNISPQIQVPTQPQSMLSSALSSLPFMSPATPAVPTTPATPTVPSTTATPTVPPTTATPTVPSTTATPTVPPTTATPTVPSTTATPTVPSITATPTVPSITDTPTVPTSTATPTVPTTPATPTVPSITDRPTVPSYSSISSTTSSSNRLPVGLPEIQREIISDSTSFGPIDRTGCVSSVPEIQTPTVPSMTTEPTVPTTPATPPVPSSISTSPVSTFGPNDREGCVSSTLETTPAVDTQQPEFVPEIQQETPVEEEEQPFLGHTLDPEVAAIPRIPDDAQPLTTGSSRFTKLRRFKTARRVRF